MRDPDRSDNLIAGLIVIAFLVVVLLCSWAAGYLHRIRAARPPDPQSQIRIPQSEIRNPESPLLPLPEDARHEDN